MKEKEKKKGAAEELFIIQRIAIILIIVATFFPAFSPTRVSKMISDNNSLFTSAVSYSSLTSEFSRAFRMNWVSENAFVVVYIASLVLLLGIIGLIVGGCMSLGNVRMRKTGILFSLAGTVVGVVGLVLTIVGYNTVNSTVMSNKLEQIGPTIPTGFYIYAVLIGVVLLTSLAAMVSLPKVEKGEKYEMESKYKLFLMFLPFIALAFAFCYLPLYGWRYAFFDYKSGDVLTMSNFVGLKWFSYLFNNGATRADLLHVMRNTLIMSFLGVGTSWIPMIFAIFLCEMKNLTFRRFVQTFTTIPNFISWVLVYALALAIFSTDGFINTFMKELGLMAQDARGVNYLMSSKFIWIKMWAWGTWKGVGWSAIIYIAGISGIDQSLYEAATVDGADRFQKMRHITLPGLLPTFFVLLLMAIAGCLSNGLDQYLVFRNPQNQDTIRVLDLWVYDLGIGGGSIPLSTVIGMAKSVISVALLFGANGVSKVLRGESIV
ncbi:MAG: sugar ABC transporter permease [Lachnospiraceae bacterium]|nr:sugar ABC transporter permease [Lachnospiraceae bacterium]